MSGWRVVLVLLVGVVFLCGGVRGEDSVVPAGVEHEEAFRQMELLAEVLLQVRKHYVEERSYEELLQGAIRGMLEELDPHSAFLDAEAYEALVEDTSGVYGGVGIQIGVQDNILTVIAPIEDTPAFRAGVQSGDRILAINGVSTSGVTLRDAVKLLRGPKGESVRMTLIGRDAQEEHDVEIVRENIVVDSVKGERLLADGVGYVRMTQFDSPSTGKLRKALVDLQGQGMQALILDLRGNPGGLLQQAIETSSLFLEAGMAVVSTVGREGEEAEVSYTSDGGGFTNFPLVILVNSGSASAAEIVAGAMQDHHRGLVIGEKSYGKASVQTVMKMAAGGGGSAIRLTTAHYYTPLHRLIHGEGIFPDIEIPLTREEWRRVQVRRAHLESPGSYGADEVAEYEDVVDRQLQRAQDVLAALLIFQKTR